MLARWLRASAADQRLLPEGRLAGPMPWVIAIMMFLTVLAAASGLGLARAANQMDADLAGRLTIQVPEPALAIREAHVRAITAQLRRIAAVSSINPIPDAQLVALLEPWLGQDGLDADLPLPAMIDVTMVRTRPEDVGAVRSAVKAIAPGARVDAHAQWLSPLASLLLSLKWLAAMLVLLMAVATSAAVVLSARAALNTHRPTIDIMHLLGATDVQVARLFQRRTALDALFGGTIGLVGGLAVMAIVGALVGEIGSDLLGSARLSLIDWAIIAALPIIGALLSTLAARLTVLSALRKNL